MMIDETVMAVIQKHTRSIEAFLEQNGVENDYGMQALQWLEGYVDRRRDQMTEKEENGLIEMIGAFLGECLCHTYNGEWVEREDEQLGVLMDDLLTAMPFNKVGKYFDNPSTESFSGMFRATPDVLKIVREKQSQTGKMDDA